VHQVDETLEDAAERGKRRQAMIRDKQLGIASQRERNLSGETGFMKMKKKMNLTWEDAAITSKIVDEKVTHVQLKDPKGLIIWTLLPQ
jgi:hypothetical protein